VEGASSPLKFNPRAMPITRVLRVKAVFPSMVFLLSRCKGMPGRFVNRPGCGAISERNLVLVDGDFAGLGHAVVLLLGAIGCGV
jgi:hypothetical protein